MTAPITALVAAVIYFRLLTIKGAEPAAPADPGPPQPPPSAAATV